MIYGILFLQFYLPCAHRMNAWCSLNRLLWSSLSHSFFLPTTSSCPLPLPVHYHFLPTTTSCPLPRSAHYHLLPTTTFCPLLVPAHYHFLSTTTFCPLPRSAHYQFLPTATSCPLPLPVHYHFLPTATYCPLPLTAHYHFLHTTTYCPLPLPVHYHFLPTATYCPLPLTAHYHFLHTTTSCTLPLPAHYHLLPRRSTSLSSPPSSHTFSVFLSCPFGTIFFPVESKIIRMRAMKAYRRSRRTSALDRSGWLASRLGRFTSKSKALPFELYSRWAGSRSGTFKYDRNILPLPEIKPRLLGFLALSLTMTPTALS